MIDNKSKITSTVFPDGSKLDYPVGMSPKKLLEIMAIVDKDRRDPKHVQTEGPAGYTVLKIAV
jgi:hypothetical protein